MAASIAICISLKPSLQLNPRFPFQRPRPSFLFRNFSRLRKTTVYAPTVRAGLDIPYAVRPGGMVESDTLGSDLRKQVMKAVDDCGGRVTVGDVASRGGLKLNEAQKALQAIAADTDGFLEVSDEGDVLFVFSKDYRSKLAAKSFLIKVEPLVEKAKSTIEYLVRVSFGTALIASIVIVYTAIIAILSSRSDDDNRGRRGGRSYNPGFNFYLSPTDLFWYWDPYYYRRQRRESQGGGMKFIESVFSFVFGDGDPNQGIEEERWKLIGQYISSNGGVVTAEELAPYLDLQTAEDDESYILPVLLRFDGQPEVDEVGNILYRFPSLQRTASPERSGRKEYVGRKWADWVDGIQRFFQEKKVEFSKTTGSERAMVIGLGGFNLFGVIFLSTLLRNMTAKPSEFISFVADIFPLLQIYAGSFFAIPLFRWVFLRKKNSEIEKRNSAREQRARLLDSPDLSLKRKILSARDMAQKTIIGRDKIVYRSDRDLAEQDYETRDWERRLEKSD